MQSTSLLPFFHEEGVKYRCKVFPWQRGDGSTHVYSTSLLSNYRCSVTKGKTKICDECSTVLHRLYKKTSLETIFVHCYSLNWRFQRQQKSWNWCWPFQPALHQRKGLFFLFFCLKTYKKRPTAARGRGEEDFHLWVSYQSKKTDA